MNFIEKKVLKVGIVGVGAIGGFILSNLESEQYLKVTAIADTLEEKRKEIAEKYPEIKVCEDFRLFPEDLDVIVESAGTGVADDVSIWGLERGRKVVISSVGGLKDIKMLRRLARDTGGHLYIPSGAIAGLDALKAIPSESIKEVVLTTTKNPLNFRKSAYVIENGINLDNLTGPKVIFDGNAGEAVKAFPKNINVSAILSYAGIGRSRTRVVVMADPEIKVNRHEIYIKSDHGEIKIQVNNLPFEINPLTSKLSAFSILAAVRSLVYDISIG